MSDGRKVEAVLPSSVRSVVLSQVVCVLCFCSPDAVALSDLSSCRDDADDEDSDVAWRGGMKPPAGADQGRGGGENGAALVSGHQHVADVPLTAGRAHLAEERSNAKST